MDENWQCEPDLEELRLSHDLIAVNVNEAIERLTNLADRGSIMSMIYLGHIYQNGPTIPPDFKNAERWLARASEQGSGVALYYLGMMYLKEERYDKARFTFEASSSAGNNTAAYRLGSIYRLGSLYIRGLGGPKDFFEARRLLALASQGGHLRARRELSYLLMHEGRTIQDKIQGVLMLLSIIGSGFMLIMRSSKFSDREIDEKFG